MSGKKQDDESKRGGRHTHGDEKRDARSQRGEETSIFTSGRFRGKGNVIGLCIKPQRRCTVTFIRTLTKLQRRGNSTHQPYPTHDFSSLFILC